MSIASEQFDREARETAAAMQPVIDLAGRVAERLYQLGWGSPNDAQHSNLRQAIPELREMMDADKPDDGGPAFPRSGFYTIEEGTHSDPQDGMTLRAYLAAKALPALIADAEVSTRKDAEGDAYFCYDHVADCGVKFADALIARLKK